MKMIILALALALALVLPAASFAQQTVEQRIAAQIGTLTIQNAALQEQVEKLQAQVKALQDKYEPKPAEAK